LKKAPQKTFDGLLPATFQHAVQRRKSFCGPEWASQLFSKKRPLHIPRGAAMLGQ
jgi:hypothetical protein